MLRFREQLSDPGLETGQGQGEQESCGLRPRRARRWARSGLQLAYWCCPTPRRERCLSGKRHGAGSWARGGFALREVGIPTSRGPEACLAQGRSQLRMAAAPKRAEPWTRSLRAFASSLLAVDAAVKAGGTKHQQGYRALLASPGEWLGVEFPPSASLLQGDSEEECEFSGGSR